MKKYTHGKRYMKARRNIATGRDNRRVRKLNRCVNVIMPRALRILKNELPKSFVNLARSLADVTKAFGELRLLPVFEKRAGREYLYGFPVVAVDEPKG